MNCVQLNIIPYSISYLGKWDPSKFSIYDILRINLMNLELMIQVLEAVTVTLCKFCILYR